MVGHCEKERSVYKNRGDYVALIYQIKQKLKRAGALLTPTVLPIFLYIVRLTCFIYQSTVASLYLIFAALSIFSIISTRYTSLSQNSLIFI